MVGQKRTETHGIGILLIFVVMASALGCDTLIELDDILIFNDCDPNGDRDSETVIPSDIDADTDSDTDSDADADGDTGDVTMNIFELRASKDTCVRSDHSMRVNDNHGCEPVLNVARGRDMHPDFPTGSPGATQIFVQFNLNGISEPVESAVLDLTVYQYLIHGNAENMRIDAYPVVPSIPMTPWIEGNGCEAPGYPRRCTNVDDARGMAWENRDGNNVDKPLLADQPVASLLVPANDIPVPGDVLSWDITDLVNDWVTGRLPNNGVALLESLGGTVFQEIYFGSRESEIYNYSISGEQVDGPRLRISTQSDSIIVI